MKNMNIVNYGFAPGLAAAMVLSVAGCTGAPESNTNGVPSSVTPDQYTPAGPSPSPNTLQDGEMQPTPERPCIAWTKVILHRGLPVRYVAPAGEFVDGGVADDVADTVYDATKRARHEGRVSIFIADVIALGTEKQLTETTTNLYMQRIAASEAAAIERQTTSRGGAIGIYTGVTKAMPTNSDGPGPEKPAKADILKVIVYEQSCTLARQLPAQDLSKLT